MANNKPKRLTAHLNLLLDTELKDDVAQLARAAGQDMSTYIRNVLRFQVKHAKKLEEQKAQREAEQRQLEIEAAAERLLAERAAQQ
jgi:hypothetical protein